MAEVDRATAIGSTDLAPDGARNLTHSAALGSRSRNAPPAGLRFAEMQRYASGSSEGSGDEGTLFGRLAAQGLRRRFRSGEALFVQGDLSDRIFLLEQGWVKISCQSSDGREAVLGIRGPGEMLGELSSLDGAPRSASAVALGAVDVVVAPARDLNRVIDEDPGAARELLAILAGRLRDADRQRLEFASLKTLGRVATRLLELSERFGERTPEGVRVDLPLSQEELAAWCGASREATVKALKALRGLGLVTTGRRTVLLHDAEALTRHTI